MKGIILAGGSGTRLYPITMATSKQLLPVYDKPMIYYPLSTLMMAGIQDILLITTEEDQNNFKRLLGDGERLGVHLSYVVQRVPNGLAQAFVLGEEFIGNNPCAMVLGDNIFYGAGLEEKLKKAKQNAFEGNATIFGYQVRDPKRFGILEFDQNNNVIGVEEKPEYPKSDYAITGLYFYPKGVSEMAKQVPLSARKEYEITDLNRMYLKSLKLKAELLKRGYTWFDTGTFESMSEASNMIKSMETQGNRIIACPEEIAFEQGWLSEETINKILEKKPKNTYGEYLERVLKKK